MSISGEQLNDHFDVIVELEDTTLGVMENSNSAVITQKGNKLLETVKEWKETLDNAFGKPESQ